MELTPPAGLAAALERALSGGQVVAPVPPDDSGSAAAVLRPDLPVTETDAGVVVLTSGSTGNPKAVVLSTSAILSSVEATHARLGGAGDWVCVLPTHYVAGMMTLARAVAAGRRAHLARPDLADLPEPDGRCYVSVVGAQLHRAAGDPALLARLAQYTAVLVGGSAVSPHLLDEVRAAGVNLVETYGMAETCGGCVYDGHPLDGVGVELAEGRIALTGPMVFSGYRLDPGLTAEVLRGRTVLTRDRGVLADGRLRITGRVDDVVISGGVNVDLAEAQRAADEVFGPPEAGGLVMLAVPDPRWGHRVVAATTGALTLAEAGARLAGRLESAALPRELRRLDAVAYTPSGKIDRPALQRAWLEAGSNDGDRG